MLWELKEKRNGLVHRSVNQDGDKLYTSEGRTSVFGRLKTLMEDMLSGKNLISAEVAAFCAEHGISATKIEATALQKIAGLKGE